MEKGRLKHEVAKRCSPELITIVDISGNLFEAEIFVLVRSIEDRVTLADPEKGEILGNADIVFSKSLNISLALPDTAWQLTQFGFSEKEERSSFFESRHRSLWSPRAKSVNRSVRKC